MIPSRFELCCLPTPCHRLPRASARLVVDLWIKRDDLTGFAGGGNKGRKLEYLVPEIQASGAEVVVTCGSTQSNFVRQLAAACRMIGVRCEAVMMHLPYEPEYGKPATPGPHRGGNMVLNELFGLVPHVMPDGSWDDLFAAADERALRLRHAGQQVYQVAIGGSSPQGAYAFWQAAQELDMPFDNVVTATSSGSTLAGLATALQGTGCRVIGISCDPEEENRDDVLRLSQGLSETFGVAAPLADVDIRFEFAGEGYGVPSPEGERARRTLAAEEAILLDSIYSAKAFAGLEALVASGEIQGRTLFWHTGGTPSIFAH